jgi:hypothetical protein
MALGGSFTTLDAVKPSELTDRPENRRGLTLLAGDCPTPGHWAGFELAMLTLLRPRTGMTDDAAAKAEAFLGEMNNEVEAALAASEERAALDKANAEREEAMKDVYAASETAAEAEAKAAAAGPREAATLRRAAAEAREVVKDYQQHANGFLPAVRDAEAALQRKRQELRAQAVAAKRAELEERRQALRSYGEGALIALSEQLLAIDALEKTLPK